jgi:hypothetical protein
MRELHQCEMHDLLTKATVAAIYGKTFNAGYQNILKENNCEAPLKAETAVGMPRRFGKTTAVGEKGECNQESMSRTNY